MRSEKKGQKGGEWLVWENCREIWEKERGSLDFSKKNR